MIHLELQHPQVALQQRREYCRWVNPETQAWNIRASQVQKLHFLIKLSILHLFLNKTSHTRTIFKLVFRTLSWVVYSFSSQSIHLPLSFLPFTTFGNRSITEIKWLEMTQTAGWQNGCCSYYLWGKMSQVCLELLSQPWVRKTLLDFIQCRKSTMSGYYR